MPIDPQNGNKAIKNITYATTDQKKFKLFLQSWLGMLAFSAILQTLPFIQFETHTTI